MVNPLSLEHFWLNKRKFDEAERIFYEAKYGGNQQTHNKRLGQTNKNGSLSNGTQLKSKVSVEIDKVRDYLKNSLSISTKTLELNERYTKLKKEKEGLVKTVEDLRKSISKLELRINTLEKGGAAPKPQAAPAPKKAEEDDDIDLFASDEEDEEAEKAREERIQQAAAKKKPKPGVVAKSSVVLDIKPWDDETDLAAMEAAVRSIEMDGLLWGKGQLLPVAFGVKKLQIVCVVEDDKVSIDELTEKLEAFEDFIQSVDVAAFNKI